MLLGEVAAIGASDAERHHAATKRPPVHHRAASTCCAQRCDGRELDKKTRRFYQRGDACVWAAGRSVTFAPAVGTARAVLGYKDNPFQRVSTLSRGEDLGNTPSVQPTTSPGTPQCYKTLKEALCSASEGMGQHSWLLLGRDGDGGPARGFAGAVPVQLQEYSPLGRALVLALLICSPVAVFPQPNAIKNLPLGSGT